LHETVAAGAQPGCKAVAGYLFGLAGELAVKEMMRASGVPKLPNGERSSDPYYKHFPELKTLLNRLGHGRRGGSLRRVSEDARLFQFWDTEMRYAQTGNIKDQWVTAWKASAERLVEEMEIL
jgi:hypothetical protein